MINQGWVYSFNGYTFVNTNLMKNYRNRICIKIIRVKGCEICQDTYLSLKSLHHDRKEPDSHFCYQTY